ncbi:10659_t:CDS:1, partial [Acaulospora morrowiae]
MDQQHQQHASDMQSETNIQQPIENQIIEYLRTLEDNHDTHDQQWIKSLLEDSYNNSSSEFTELGTIINITVLDT